MMTAAVKSQSAFRQAEDFAAEALKKMGHIIIARNYNVPQLGELDIVSLRQGCLYAVEVKARKRGRTAGSRGAFSAAKQYRTRRALRLFMQEQGQSGRNSSLLAAEITWDPNQRIKGCRFADWNQ